MDPNTTQHIVGELAPRVENMVEQGYQQVVITTVEIRLALLRFLEPNFPRLQVLSYQELPPSTQIENFGVITAPANMMALENSSSQLSRVKRSSKKSVECRRDAPFGPNSSLLTWTRFISPRFRASNLNSKSFISARSDSLDAL